jgi:hypothetical protein
MSPSRGVNDHQLIEPGKGRMLRISAVALEFGWAANPKAKIAGAGITIWHTPETIVMSFL